MSENQSLISQSCMKMMEDAVAATIISKNGQVAFFYGANGRITLSAEDAALIMKTIGELENKYEEQ